MEIRSLLFFFLIILFVTNDVNAKRSSLRGFSSGSSRSSHSSGSRSYGNSFGRTSNSHSFGTVLGRHTIASNPTRSSSDGYTRRSNSFGHETSQTSHQQKKDSSTSFLHAEGGGLTQPKTYLGSPVGRTDVTTKMKQNSAPYKPSAPYNPSASHNPTPYNPSAPYNPSISYNPSVQPADQLSKTVISSQNHAPTSFGQSNTPSNPSWANPHFNPNQPHPPSPGSTFNNIGFKDHLRPTLMPTPQQGVAYPRPPYSISNSNSYFSPHPISHANQPHFTHNPSQMIRHPSSYPNVSPSVPSTFGNPYSTHPIGTTYGPVGHNYYPQQHILAQPAAQPYIPGQTVIMVPGQQDSGRGLGQMVKEALVFSTINAGVNRLLNPHHHYVHNSRPVDNNAGTTSETHITYNNHYFNTASADNTAPVSVSPYRLQENIPGTYSANANPVNNPVITPGVSMPIIVGNNSVIYPNTPLSNPSATGITSNINNSSVSLNSNAFTGNAIYNQEVSNQGITAYSPQYKISDNDLWTLTEELFGKQEINVSRYITLHLQNKSRNVTDAAMEPLIYAQQEIYNYPTIWIIRALYDNYEHNSTVKEKHIPEKQKEQDLLLDLFLNTNVMARTMQWLSDRDFINPNDFERKETLRHIWFSQFDGATSGFERVFTSERYDQDLLGVQDWIYFDYQESKNRINYMGYVDMLKLGDNISLLKLNFKMDEIIRPNATIFIGTLPELEMSLYTICFYARPNDLCPVSLGGAKFNIFTHSFRYYGKDLIDLALPIF